MINKNYYLKKFAFADEIDSIDEAKAILNKEYKNPLRASKILLPMAGGALIPALAERLSGDEAPGRVEAFTRAAAIMGLGGLGIDALHFLKNKYKKHKAKQYIKKYVKENV